jgi:enoyl-CoA hydratase/carnithine racemase
VSAESRGRYATLAIDAPAPHVVRVTLSRPEALNTFHTRMGEDLLACFTHLLDIHPDTRVVIVTGAGRAFCAGADLKERHTLDDEQWERQHRTFERAMAAVAATPVPVIAAVNGPATGGGCELALACDWIVASTDAAFGQPEVHRGLMPGLGGTQRLPRRVGMARAAELLMTGRLVDGEEAARIGLANAVTAPDALQRYTLELAAAVTRAAPLAVRAIKRAVDAGAHLPMPEALAVEIAEYDEVVKSDDRREGVAAFNEKRPPRFRGR